MEDIMSKILLQKGFLEEKEGKTRPTKKGKEFIRKVKNGEEAPEIEELTTVLLKETEKRVGRPLTKDEKKQISGHYENTIKLMIKEDLEPPPRPGIAG